MNWYAHIDTVDADEGQYRVRVHELLEIEEGIVNGDLIMEFSYQAEERNGRFISGAPLRRKIERRVAEELSA